jgi:hypothetical protein
LEQPFRGIPEIKGHEVNFNNVKIALHLPGAIHCTEATGTLLLGTFRLQARGAMVIKGKGEMNTFLLLNSEAIPNG